MKKQTIKEAILEAVHFEIRCASYGFGTAGAFMSWAGNLADAITRIFEFHMADKRACIFKLLDVAEDYIADAMFAGKHDERVAFLMADARHAVFSRDYRTMSRHDQKYYDAYRDCRLAFGWDSVDSERYEDVLAQGREAAEILHEKWRLEMEQEAQATLEAATAEPEQAAAMEQAVEAGMAEVEARMAEVEAGMEEVEAPYERSTTYLGDEIRLFLTPSLNLVEEKLLKAKDEKKAAGGLGKQAERMKAGYTWGDVLEVYLNALWHIGEACELLAEAADIMGEDGSKQRAMAKRYKEWAWERGKSS